MTKRLRGFITLLAAIGLLATAFDLFLLIHGPINYGSSGNGSVGMGSIWTTWPNFAWCAVLALGFTAWSYLLRRAD